MTKKTRKSASAPKSHRRDQNAIDMSQISSDELDTLVAMLSLQSRPKALDLEGLLPQGSYLRRLCSCFGKSDAGPTVALFQLIAVAASWLTQNGAAIQIPGLHPKRPILWTIALTQDEHGARRATKKMNEILFPNEDAPGVRRLVTEGRDLNWINDLADNNGAFWLQHDAGYILQNALKSRPMREGMLTAAVHDQISFSTKGTKGRCVLDDPHFTFLGLSTRARWRAQIDETNMLDSLFQRFTYVLAEPAVNKVVFDTPFPFEETCPDAKQRRLGEIWRSLCLQPGAKGAYEVEDAVAPYLLLWWRGLRAQWGDGALPAAFVQSAGDTIQSYLVILHFLLGRSGRKIDIETAELATKYVEFHLESTLTLLRESDTDLRDRVKRVASGYRKLLARDGNTVNARDVCRNLSKQQREEISSSFVSTVLMAFDRLAKQPDGFSEAFSRAETLRDHEEGHAESRRNRDKDGVAPRDKRELYRNTKRITRVLAYAKKMTRGRAVAPGNVVDLDSESPRVALTTHVHAREKVRDFNDR
ncbi:MULTISPECIES: hypothetical protein [unclassified Marinovum]